jgi:hypothetical protein
MITPRTKPSSFFPEEAADDLSVVQQRKAKLEGYVQTLAAMDELIDFAAMASAVDKCPDLMISHTPIGGNHLDNERDEHETKSL